MLLEIGTTNGGTLFLFSHVAYKDAIIISVNLLGGRFSGGYSKWRKLLYKSFALPDQRLILLMADSHKDETLAKVKAKAILGETKLDFLFIDRDHTYEGVEKDFEMYSPLVRRGGIIAFHDIVLGTPKTLVMCLSFGEK